MILVWIHIPSMGEPTLGVHLINENLKNKIFHLNTWKDLRSKTLWYFFVSFCVILYRYVWIKVKIFKIANEVENHNVVYTIHADTYIS